MSGRVVSLHVAASEGADIESPERVEIRADHGIVGDRKAKSGVKGQVTVFSLEKLAEASQELGRPIEAGRTRRNIAVEGVELPDLGGRLRLGPVLVEVTQDAAPCNLMNELFGHGAKDALEDRAGVRAKVLEGGELGIGDAVSADD
ncbi:MAG: MOSC domain-containing protein [Acidobacteriota bacterium]